MSETRIDLNKALGYFALKGKVEIKSSVWGYSVIVDGTYQGKGSSVEHAVVDLINHRRNSLVKDMEKMNNSLLEMNALVNG